MSEFVEQCRQEWRRLGVPDSLAEEMATDLEADIEEAMSEGVSVHELLGGSASDPRSFAGSWAAERGIVPAPTDAANDHRRPLVLMAFTVIAGTAAIFAALALLFGEPKVATVAVRTPGAHLPAATAGSGLPPGTGRAIVLHTSAAAPVEWVLLVLATIALGFAVWLWSSRRRQHRPGVPASA